MSLSQREVAVKLLLQDIEEAPALAELHPPPGMVQPLRCILGINTMAIVLPMAVCDLATAMATTSHWSMDSVALVTNELLHCVAALHENNHVHRDITPCNILIMPSGRVVLCDNSTVRRAPPHLPSCRHSSVVSLTPDVTTEAFVAPEVMLGEEFTQASDMFAVGCVLGQLLTGEVLFPMDACSRAAHLGTLLHITQQPQQQQQAPSGALHTNGISSSGGASPPDQHQKLPPPRQVQSHDLPAQAAAWLQDMEPSLVPFSSQIREHLRQHPALSSAMALLRSLLHNDPSSRPTARSALEHPFFSECCPLGGVQPRGSLRWCRLVRHWHTVQQRTALDDQHPSLVQEALDALQNIVQNGAVVQDMRLRPPRVTAMPTVRRTFIEALAERAAWLKAQPANRNLSTPLAQVCVARALQTFDTFPLPSDVNGMGGHFTPQQFTIQDLAVVLLRFAVASLVNAAREVHASLPIRCAMADAIATKLVILVTAGHVAETDNLVDLSLASTHCTPTLCTMAMLVMLLAPLTTRARQEAVLHGLELRIPYMRSLKQVLERQHPAAMPFILSL
jgi:serine/threonine protein kinase